MGNILPDKINISLVFILIKKLCIPLTVLYKSSANVYDSFYISTPEVSAWYARHSWKFGDFHSFYITGFHSVLFTLEMSLDDLNTWNSSIRIKFYSKRKGNIVFQINRYERSIIIFTVMLDFLRKGLVDTFYKFSF